MPVTGENQDIHLDPPRRLAVSGDGFAEFCFSPDGRHLACTRTDGIHLIEVESGTDTRIASGLSPSWLGPDGILFESEDALWVSRPGGGAEKLDISIPNAPGACLRAPLAAPVEHVALCHVSNVATAESLLRRHFFGIVDLDARTVAITAQETYGGTAAWAPGGNLAACAAHEAPGGRISIVTRAGEVTARFTGLLPSFAPDGNTLAFNELGQIRVARPSGDTWEVAEAASDMPSDSTNVRSNPPLWLDNHVVLLEVQGKLLAFDTTRNITRDVTELTGLAHRGVPTLALTGDRRALVAEMDEDGMFHLVSFAISGAQAT